MGYSFCFLSVFAKNVTSTFWLSFSNLTLFGSHTLIPPGRSGCVQVGAGECSNEHEAKHLSPSEPDPLSCRVDWVHAGLNKKYMKHEAMLVRFLTSSHQRTTNEWANLIDTRAVRHNRTNCLRICSVPLFVLLIHTHTSSMTWRKPNKGLFWLE